MDCYLDMDGLLANLFDDVSYRLHRKKYNENTPLDKLETKRVWENHDIFSEKVGDVEEIFAQLKPYHTNEILLDKVVEHFGGFRLCSHPAKLAPEACIRGKMRWIAQHIEPKYGEHYLGAEFPMRKEEFAIGADGEPNLLIDDFRPFVEAWKSRGGVAIRVRSDKFAELEDFRSYLFEQFEMAKIPRFIG